MKFVVRSVRDGAQAVDELRLDAASASELQRDLQAQGHTVLSIRRPWLDLASLRRGAGANFGAQAYALACQELRILLQAGLTVVEAVDTLAARKGAYPTHALAQALLERLQRGQSLSIALQQLPAAPPVLVAAVRAGEHASNLVQALDEYLRYDSLVQQLRKKVISAAIYPALVTALGTVISLFLLLVVMPNFARMYQNLRSQAQGAGALMVEFALWASAHQKALITAVLVLALLITLWVGLGYARVWVKQVLQRVPGVRDRWHDFELALAYQALALLVRGGYPLPQALHIASGSTLNAQTRTALHQAQEAIERGVAVSKALSDANLCDEVSRRLFAASERNASFAATAAAVSRLHSERFELFIERVMRLVEPILLLAVALGVGTLVVLMYLPVFDIATRLQ